MSPKIPGNVTEYYVGKKIPRGVRNNNPGNIRIGDNWQGLAPMQEDGSFCQFSDAKYGIRALAYLLLKSYHIKRGLNTVRKIINRWAPPSENDTASYVMQVAKAMQVGADEAIDLTKEFALAGLVAAIIKHENGAQPYSGLQIMAGVRMVTGETTNGAS